MMGCLPSISAAILDTRALCSSSLLSSTIKGGVESRSIRGRAPFPFAWTPLLAGGCVKLMLGGKESVEDDAIQSESLFFMPRDPEAAEGDR